MGSPLSPGTKLGRYEIRSQLGAGGMGEVYLAQDLQLGRAVALKILPEAVAADQNRMQRFVQEAKAASALNHPDILTVYEIGETDSTHFIATEYIEGETLRQRLSRPQPRLNETLDICIQVANALAAAHQAGIVHRDLKPENIMIRRDGIVKVLDFGLAKLTAPDSANLDTQAATRAQFHTDPGTVIGTANYMSPEQARGIPVDTRTDIFSFGVVLYEMVAGRPPFLGSNTSEVIASILSDKETQPLARYAREVPAELERIVSKALRKNRDERYQTIKDLLLDLKSLKQELEFAAKLEHSAAPATPDGATAIDAGRPIETARVEAAQSTASRQNVFTGISQHKRSVGIASAVLLLAIAGTSYWFFTRSLSDTNLIQSIAVLPFVNASGNADVEYLSDGMTESLITSLSQLPKLNVKARSSVFRYKGKEIEPRKVGAELGVQAVLLGRVVERDNNLTLYIELVDASTENTLWKTDYNRPMSNLAALQSELARDVATKLRARLSGADEQKLVKNYTANAEAYRLYLKGRYHCTKVTRSEIQTGISYFQRAIEIDPAYALGYAGLAEGYRSLGLAGEMPPIEVFPKAKEAAQKAIETDDTLAEAHAVLGYIIFWYDRDWNAAEAQIKRALELDPNSAEAHHAHAHLLSNLGRHPEALAEAKRARELDPLNLRINALGGQFLVHAGRPDEALTELRKVFELDSNYWLPHSFAASAYIEKGMFAEAVAEARRATELPGVSSQPHGFLGLALAKSGKQAEARMVLERLLTASKERYVSSYAVAMIYNGLGERDEAFNWLERAYEMRDPRMTFLKVDQKWNNLRSDPRFQDLMRRVGF